MTSGAFHANGPISIFFMRARWLREGAAEPAVQDLDRLRELLAQAVLLHERAVQVHRRAAADVDAERSLVLVIQLRRHHRDAARHGDGDRGPRTRVLEGLRVVERHRARVVVDLHHEAADEIVAQHAGGIAPEEGCDEAVERQDRDLLPRDLDAVAVRARDLDGRELREADVARGPGTHRLHLALDVMPCDAAQALSSRVTLAPVSTMKSSAGPPSIEALSHTCRSP